jgi:hypothetical protein
VSIELVCIIAGFVLGVAGTGSIAAYLFFTRVYRGTGNQYAIRLGQLLVGASFIGSFLLLTKVWEQIGILPHSSPYYASLYAFALSSGCVMFLALRAEIRWRKSSSRDRTSASAHNKEQPPLTHVGRRILAWLVVLAIVSVGFAIALIVRWPKPSSLFLGAAFWLCWFGIFVLLTTARDRTYALQLQRFVLVAFACVEISTLALYWKFRDSTPAFSSAALIAAVLLCVGAATALLIMRRIMPRS